MSSKTREADRYGTCLVPLPFPSSAQSVPSPMRAKFGCHLTYEFLHTPRTPRVSKLECQEQSWAGAAATAGDCVTPLAEALGGDRMLFVRFRLHPIIMCIQYLDRLSSAAISTTVQFGR